MSNADYKQAQNQVYQALRHIHLAAESISLLRVLRFTSPWHPKRWIRWFQQRKRSLLDLLFFTPPFSAAIYGLGLLYVEFAEVAGHLVAGSVYYTIVATGYFVLREKKKNR